MPLSMTGFAARKGQGAGHGWAVGRPAGGPGRALAVDAQTDEREIRSRVVCRRVAAVQRGLRRGLGQWARHGNMR